VVILDEKLRKRWRGGDAGEELRKQWRIFQKLRKRWRGVGAIG
jgi:hypothetical protein